MILTILTILISITIYITLGILVTRLTDFLSTKFSVPDAGGLRGMITVFWPCILIALICMVIFDIGGRISINKTFIKIWNKVYGIKKDTK